MSAATVLRALTLPGLPESVREFRALARAASTTEYQAETAALCVSELVTNAIVHTRSGKPGGEVTVEIEAARRPGELRISVIDNGPRWTEFGAAAEPGPSNGYGLGIVDAVAAEWGVMWAAGGGSCSWCEIPAVAS
jgi:anti-sigma regulatory factor (Ser/Thr protein kinase)